MSQVLATAAPVVGRHRAVLGVGAVALAVGAALPFTLYSLATDYRHGAVLGELALVPLCALALAVVAAVRHPWVLQLRAGRADYVVAAVAGSAAMLLLAWGSVAAGNHYGSLRPDLLALPAVAVAAVCLVFGVRALVAFVAPLALAVLAWPLPLRAVLEPVSDVVALATATAVKGVLHLLPLAAVVPGPGDLRLSIAGPDGQFDVLVASACSGVAGIVGMLLVGLTAQYVLHGTPRARLLWLAVAVGTAWVLNLVRILALLALGSTMGQRVALDIVHPAAGLVLLNVAVAGLLLAAGRFGLTLSLRRRAPYDTPLTTPVEPQHRMTPGERARRGAALGCVVLALAVVGTTVPVTAMASSRGAATATAFAEAPALGSRFAVGDAQEKGWARAYFGKDSAWTRFHARPTSDAVGYSLWVDSVLTSDWSALRAHPLLDCYAFHGYELVSTGRPTLAGGLLAEEVVYRRDDGATWHVLSWEWPVRTPSGGTAHERVTLLASTSRTDLPAAVSPATDGGLRGALARRMTPSGSGADPNTALSAALRADASASITLHLTPGTAGGAQ